jgi:hypothetical protein
MEDALYVMRDAVHIILKCPETRRLREHPSRKWHTMMK